MSDFGRWLLDISNVFVVALTLAVIIAIVELGWKLLTEDLVDENKDDLDERS